MGAGEAGKSTWLKWMLLFISLAGNSQTPQARVAVVSPKQLPHDHSVWAPGVGWGTGESNEVRSQGDAK